MFHSFSSKLLQSLIPAACLCASSLSAQVIFDDTAGTLPGSQAWLVGGVIPPGTESIISSGVQLDTSASESIQSGYSNYIPFINTLKNGTFPVLDPTVGFTLSFELKVVSETHTGSDNRAGFNVILLGSDNQGVEISFWDDTIFALNDDLPTFSHGEEVSFDTSSNEVNYALSILGSNYSLKANDAEILSGTTRDYSAFGVPYSLPNYLFLGDDTTSAGALVELGNVEIGPIPEPSTYALVIGLAVIGYAARRKFSA